MEYFEDIADIDDEAAIDDEEKEIEQKSTVPEGGTCNNKCSCMP